MTLDLRKSVVRTELKYPFRAVIDTIYRNHYRSYDPDGNDIEEAVPLRLEKDASFSWVTFAGEADFSAIRFGGLADFYDVTFQRSANFSSDTFHHRANFLNATFRLEGNFEKAYFQANADFEGAFFQVDTYFYNPANFERAVFLKKANFRAIVFQNAAVFKSDTFMDEASFSGDAFLNENNFNWTLFENEVEFDHSVFLKDAEFGVCSFSKKADFGSCHFRGIADFTACTIKKELDFSGAIFDKAAYLNYFKPTESTKVLFRRAQLPDRIDFSYNSQIQKADFTEADFKRDSFYTLKQRRWHYINLYRTDLLNVKIDYEYFRFSFYDYSERDGRVNEFYSDTSFVSDSETVNGLLRNPIYMEYIEHVFPGSKHYASDGFLATLRDKIVKRWWKDYILPRYLHKGMFPLKDSVIVDFTWFYVAGHHFFPRQLRNEEILSIYQREIKILGDQGQSLSKQKLDIEYHDFLYGKNFILHIWNCYGYHKEWVFYWAVIFLMFFWGVTFLCLPFLREHVYTVSFFEAQDVRFTRPRVKPPESEWHAYFMPPEVVPKPKSFFVRLASRVWYSLVYTAVIFFLFSLKIDNFKFSLKFSRILGSLYVVIVYSAGIICLAYMANFVLQK